MKSNDKFQDEMNLETAQEQQKQHNCDSANENDSVEVNQTLDADNSESDGEQQEDIILNMLKKYSLKVALGVLLLVAIVWGGMKVYDHFHNNNADVSYWEEPQSNPISHEGGVVNIVNPITGNLIVEDIDWFRYNDDKDSIVLFAKNGKRGFCNILTDKVIVSPVTYSKAWVFSEGLAAVEKDGYIGFINTSGKLVIGCKYPYRGNPLYQFVFHDGHCVVANSDNKLGVIDANGKWVVEPIYDNVQLTKDYAVVYAEGDFKKQIDYDGNVLQDGIIDHIEPLHYDVSYIDLETGCPEDASVRNANYYEYQVGSYAGLINDRGQFITPPIYTSISCISPTLFCATLQDGFSVVFIDKNGKVISGK